jgi:Uri superfamily endonuclease
MREYDVTITETLRKTVTVEAESMAEAEQKINDAWHNSEYILDADDFVEVEFESDEPVVELSYREMSDMFTHINKIGADHLCGYIVFSEDSFKDHFSEQSRTYVVSSDNKAFKPGMGGYSIFGSCLDGTDQNIRLEGYIRGEKAWHIERCYMKKDDYNRAYSQPVISDKEHEAR